MAKSYNPADLENSFFEHWFVDSLTCTFNESISKSTVIKNFCKIFFKHIKHLIKDKFQCILKLSRDEKIDVKAELTLEQISWLKKAVKDQFTLKFHLSTLLEEGKQYLRCYNVFEPDPDSSGGIESTTESVSTSWVLPDTLEDEYVSYNYSIDEICEKAKANSVKSW